MKDINLLQIDLDELDNHDLNQLLSILERSSKDYYVPSCPVSNEYINSKLNQLQSYIETERNLGSMLATVKYQIATYSGQIQVNCDPNDENDHIIAKAKKIKK